MAYGLQVWNESGVLRVDISTRTILQLSYYTGTGVTDPDYVSVPGMTAADTSYALIDISNRLNSSMAKGTNQVVLTNYDGATYAFYVMRV